MSSSSKKRKNKWKSIAVEEILPNAIVRPTTSWAEEVESELNEYTIKKISSISLPTAPRATCDVFIDENKINPNGPFTAYLSNLPYDITEDDIAHHFKEYKVEDIQLPKDSRHDRMRGFGYVQFKDKSSLLQALHEGEVTLKGRLVRISLPNDEEQNKDKGSRGGVSFSRRDVSDRIDGVERNLGEWRAAAPIPHDPDKGFTGPNRREGGPGGPFREPKAFDEPRPFTRGGFRDKDRDFDNRSNDRGGNRMFGKGYDRDDRGSRMGFGGKGYNEDREMRRDLDRDMRRDSNREMRREPDREMRREPDREMRREPDREMRRDFDREPVAKEEPKSRPKLEIQPRTKPLEPNVPEALPSSIFGGAKPVDTLKREMEIEAKLSSKAASQPVTRSRTSTPPPRSLTPHSYHSRSSSTSSTSSFRYRNAESVERRQERRQSDDESKDISSNKSHDDNVASETSKEPEFKEPEPPKNVWEQRKAASAAAVAETPVSDAPTSVIEKSNVYENPVDVNVVENRSRNEDASKESGSVAGDDEERRASVDRKNSTDRYVPRQRSTVDKNSNSDDDFVRYEPDHFSNPDAPQYQQQQSSNRGGGPRYSDNSKFNFNRNNNGYRNRDNRRSDTRRPDNGQYRRDDNYVSRNSENSAFGSKWNSASRNRNSGPGPRRYGDRDNGYSQRDRYDNGSSFSKQSSCSSSTTNLRDDDRFDKKADERLNVEEPREDTETGDERVNIIVNDDNANKKTVENGNENGVDTDDPTRKSDENIAVDERSENDNAFSSSKNRKRDKKKKNQVKDSDQLNEKDGDRPNDRQKNQKDEKKKNVDNQVNEKVNNKNNAKNKEKTTKKKSELRRDGEDIAQMPKAKEEKAPNFQDSNRFKFLADE